MSFESVRSEYEYNIEFIRKLQSRFTSESKKSTCPSHKEAMADAVGVLASIVKEYEKLIKIEDEKG